MSKYKDQYVDLNNDNVSTTKIINLVGHDKQVLDVGCSSGYVAKVLKEQFNCKVWGIEIDPSDAELALNYCEEVIVADLEIDSWQEKLRKGQFDVIILADILEHLKNPLQVLQNLKKYLTNDGYFAISIPNIAHAFIRLELLQGNFEYEQTGILDSTHLKYFTKQSFIDLLHKAGLKISNIDSTTFDIPLEYIEQKSSELKIDKETLQSLLFSSESISYQYIFQAKINAEEIDLKKTFIAKPMFEINDLIKRKNNILQLKNFEISKFSDINIQLENRISHLNQIINEKEARISELKQLDNSKEARISELVYLCKQIAEKNENYQIKNDMLNKKLSSTEQAYLKAQNTLNEIFKSRTWKLFTLYKKFADPIFIMKHNFIKFLSSLKNKGLINTLKRTKQFLLKKNIPNNVKISYTDWIKAYELPKDYYQKAEEYIENFAHKPLLSIILPTYNSNIKWLKDALDSVRSQNYKNWECIIVDDASPKEEVRIFLKNYCQKDKRFNLVFLEQNLHISGSSNKGLEKVKGEFVILMDHDDTLSSNALYEIAKILNENPKADLIYSDRDMLDLEGNRWGPFFKPDYSPELLESCMYMEHLNAFRTSILKKIKGWRKGTEGAQDWDLVLRFLEETKNVYHISKILYHWRDDPNSVGSSKKTKDIQKNILEDYLVRNNIKGEVRKGYWEGSYRIKRSIIGNPKVSIIIPMKDKSEVTKKCVESILKKTDYKNYEIIIVDNNSEEEETYKFFEWAIKKGCKVIKYHKTFNFSAINNYASKKAKGDLLLFLNNDTEIINNEWIESMIEYAQRQEIGCVGAKLIYPNGTIQHAGIIVGLGGAAAHSHRQFPKDRDGYGGFINIVRNYSAVTAACLMIRKEVFDEIGGFEESFKIAYNDVDLCLKAVSHGYRNVYTPYAQLYHYESLTRKHAQELQQEIDKLNKKWSYYFTNGDPFYNVNLTLAKEDFDLRIE